MPYDTIDDIFKFCEPYNEEYINSLIDAIKDNKIVPYIGAGVSILNGVYPSWGNFLNDTHREYVKEKEDLENYNKIETFEEKATFLYERMGKLDFSSHLKKVFSPDKLESVKNQFNEFPISKLPIIFKRNMLITTNYDKVTENIYHEKHTTPLEVYDISHEEVFNRSLREGSLTLFKIHGDISEPTSSIVLTQEQYNKVYDNDGTLSKALEQITKSKSFLFLGCSLDNDRPIDIIGKHSKDGIEHFAVVNCTTEKKQKRRLELQNKLNTFAILYPSGEHHCLNIILEHITKEVNRPEYLDQGFMDKEWFDTQCKKQITKLGDRYNPQVNIALELNTLFDAIGQNQAFYDQVHQKTHEFLLKFKYIKNDPIIKTISDISSYIKQFLGEQRALFDSNLLQKHIDKLLETLHNTLFSVKEIEKNKDGTPASKNDTIYYLSRAISATNVYSEFIKSNYIKLYNNPYLLLDGEGGVGKSHLFADIIETRINDSELSLFFLGQEFSENIDPLITFRKMLNINSNSAGLLARLNSIADTKKSRILIFIDALNEGNGKAIWKEQLAGLVKDVKKYPNLGFIASIRSESLRSLFENNTSLKNDFVQVKHEGFSTSTYEAIMRYFAEHHITYSSIPLLIKEFSNPLFLRLFCRAYQNTSISFETITLNDLFTNYLDKINKILSSSCEYDEYANVLQEIVDNFVKYKFKNNNGSNLIELSIANSLINDIRAKYSAKNTLFKELISCGFLTHIESYDGKEYIYITYEKLDDYFYAKLLIAELKVLGIEKFKATYDKLIYYPNVLESLSLVLSESTQYEIFDIIKHEKNEKSFLIDAFCSALHWRSAKSISECTQNIVNQLLKNHNQELFEALLFLSGKDSHPLNAKYLTTFFKSLKMPDRDSYFISLFDSLYNYNEENAITWLFHFCSQKHTESLKNEYIFLHSITIVMFFISPNNKLRDNATRALIELLENRIPLLISVLDYYKNIDDPYVMDRLYAVAFGCIVREDKKDNIVKLAKYTYQEIFEKEEVYTNILVRDYARNIVEFAKVNVASKELLHLNTVPPYKSQFPEIPSDEEIKKYHFDYNNKNNPEYYETQNTILASMDIGSHTYGDFGRYIFNSYFNSYLNDKNKITIDNLHKIAVNKIFDLGYDINKHGYYDRYGNHEFRNGRTRNAQFERIGKKYQWIALYELAAQVADRYKLCIKSYDSEQEDRYEYCQGAFEPDLRDFDPTLITNISKKKQANTVKCLYTNFNIQNDEWINTQADLPDITQLLKVEYCGKQYISLHGHFKWSDKIELGIERYEEEHKDLWLFFNSYIVKEESYNRFIEFLQDKQIWGRTLQEPTENRQIYLREYFWSWSYQYAIKEYYVYNWCPIIDEYKNINVLPLTDEDKVLLPVAKYESDRDGDKVLHGETPSIALLCNDIIHTLVLKSKNNSNSCMYNCKNELIYFDGCELFEEREGCYIEEEALLEYLSAKNYKIFWTGMGEKTIYDNKDYPMATLSGLFEYKKTKELTGKFKVKEKQFEHIERSFDTQELTQVEEFFKATQNNLEVK